MIKRLVVEVGIFDDIIIVVIGLKEINDLFINFDEYSVFVEVCIQCNV